MLAQFYQCQFISNSLWQHIFQKEWASEKHKPSPLTNLQQAESMVQSQSSFKYLHYFP